MRSRRYKQHHATDCLVAHDKAGWHVMYEYVMKRQYNPLEFYKLKHIRWWYIVHRWIQVLVSDSEKFIENDSELRKIRCAEKYEMHNFNLEY